LENYVSFFALLCSVLDQLYSYVQAFIMLNVTHLIKVGHMSEILGYMHDT